MKLIENKKVILSDLYTPVSVYLKIRDHYPAVVMLESSDYSNKEGSYSFIAFDELSTLEIENFKVNIKSKYQSLKSTSLQDDVVTEINHFIASFTYDNKPTSFNGLFGYTSFEAIQYFEENLYQKKTKPYDIPDIKYSLYRFILVFDHFRNELTLLENCPTNESSRLDNVTNIIDRQDCQTLPYEIIGEPIPNMSDREFKNMVKECKNHCQRGDVFQIVPSRKYDIKINGDEFNIYRKLRSVNPSPYLFYFDYVNYKLFGSSPEAQIIIENNEAEVHPIAGTIKRTMDNNQDKINTYQLLNDPKENAEHIMLVDLARNDLSKNCTEVNVTSFKEVQNFSHVIHLVSRVKGNIKNNTSAYQIFADTFPQGTLSGAPKIKAIQLIEELEPNHRGHYGGAIGILGFNNNLNHAIIIRSILSYRGILNLQAGAGIVIDSNEEFELKEVNNKLGALMKAIN